jgi:hypothetical protein
MLAPGSPAFPATSSMRHFDCVAARSKADLPSNGTKVRSAKWHEGTIRNANREVLENQGS